MIVVENCYGPRYTRVWSEAMTLTAHGWDVTVVCPAPDDAGNGPHRSLGAPPPQVIDGITVHAFPLVFSERGVRGYLREYALAFWHIAGRMRTAWRTGPFATVQFCNPPDLFFPLAWLYRLRGAAIVFDHHDLFPEVVRWRFEGWFGGLLHAMARAAEYLTFRGADVVLATNRSSEQVALRRGGVRPERVFVVRNGPRTDQFTPVEPVPALRRGKPHMACYVGVMGQQDSVLELAEVIRQVVHEHGRADVLFALLGDGAVRRETQERLRAWGLEDHVVMPGMVRDRLLLRQYIRTADVCLAPEQSSPLNERSTFIKVGEYMAMARPVLAYDLAETRYTAGEAAAYVEPGNIAAYADALIALLDDPSRRERMGRIGRERVVRELAWEHQEPWLLRAYDTALQRSRVYRRAMAG